MAYYVTIPADNEAPLPDICVHCGKNESDTERTLSYTKASLLGHISQDLFAKHEEYTLPICSQCLTRIKILRLLPSSAVTFAAALFFLVPQLSDFKSVLFGVALISVAIGVIGRVIEGWKLEIVRMNETVIVFKTSKKWYAEKIAKMNNTTTKWLPTYLRFRE